MKTLNKNGPKIDAWEMPKRLAPHFLLEKPIS